MIKFFTILIIFPIVAFQSLSSIHAQTPTPGPRPTTSYELFWPIVAGRIPGDPLYSLKMIKEKIQLFLSINSSQKAGFYLTLSKKRLVEAEKIINDKNDYLLATQTVNLSANYLDQAASLAQSLPSNQLNSELRQTIIREGENEIFFLNLLSKQTPTETQSSFLASSTQMQQALDRLKTP